MGRKLEDLIAQLEEAGEEKQIKALQWIAYEMDPADLARVLPLLRRLSGHSSPAVRFHARLALDEVERRSGVDRAPAPHDERELLAMLGDASAEVRLRGALSCYAVRSAGLFRALRDLLRREGDPWVRASLVKALAAYRRTVSLPLLMRHLSDPDGRVRANTVEALAELENPVVNSRIAEMIDDPEHRVQAAVLAALGREGKGNIRPRVESMLASGRVWLQSSAVYVLQQVMPPWGLEVLERFQEAGIGDRRLRGRVANLVEVIRRRDPGASASAGAGARPPPAGDAAAEAITDKVGDEVEDAGKDLERTDGGGHRG
jgi:hypothetical protein